MTDGQHALIIEDEMLIGMDLVHCLSELGFDSFAFAGTQVQAIEQARLRRPDLVTVDLGLLDGDGRSAVSALRAEFGSLRCMYITGDPRGVADAAGVVVSKPFAPGDLADAWSRLRVL
jgi:CheY-like chemotaxis protein